MIEIGLYSLKEHVKKKIFVLLIASIFYLASTAGYSQVLNFCPGQVAASCGDEFYLYDDICKKKCFDVDVGSLDSSSREEERVKVFCEGDPACSGYNSLRDFDPYNYVVGFFKKESIARPDISEGDNVNPSSQGTGDKKTKKNTSCHPVNFQTGEKVEFATDYLEENSDFPLVVTRTLVGKTYRTGPAEVSGILGVGWRTNFDNRLRVTTESSSVPKGMCRVTTDGIVYNSANCNIATAFTTKRIALMLENTVTVFEPVDGSPGEFENIGFQSYYKDASLMYDSALSQWVIAFQNGLVYRYNKNGLLKSVTNINGIRHSYAYSGNKLSSITHSSGKQLFFHWNAEHVELIITPEDEIISYFGESYWDAFVGRNRFLLERVEFSNTDADKIRYEYNDPYSILLTDVYLDDIKYKEITYHSDGRVKSSGLVDNVEVSHFEYDDYNNTTTVTNAKGAKTKYKYTGTSNEVLTKIDRLAESSDACPSASIHYDYGSTYNLRRMDFKRDWKGNKTLYTYYPDTDLVETEYFDGLTTKYEWDINKRPIMVTRWKGALPQVNCHLSSCSTYVTEDDPFIHRQEWVYNAENNRLSMTKIIDSKGNISETNYSYEFYSSNIVKQEIVDGPRENVNDLTFINYDSRGRVVSTINAADHKWEYFYYSNKSKPYKTIDPNNVVTEFLYDGRGRVKEKKIHGDSVLLHKYNYNRFGKRSFVSVPGFTREYKYDSAGRYTGWSDGEVQNTDYINRRKVVVYDNLSNVIETRMEYVKVELDGSTPIYIDIPDLALKWKYDRLGNLEASLTDYGHNSNTFTYDAALNLKTSHDSVSFTEYLYDAKNRITKQLTDNVEAMGFVYGDNNELSKFTDPRNNVTTYSVHDISKKEVNSPDAGYIQKKFDAAGNLVSLQKTGKNIISYSYDELNRLKYALEGGTPYPKIFFYYDDHPACPDGKNLIGKICYVTDGVGTTHYSYTKTGNIEWQKTSIMGNKYSLNYQYDSLDRLSTIMYGGQSMGVRYTYGKDSVPTGVEALVNNSWVPVVSLKVGPRSKEYTYGNGVASQYIFDGDGGLLAINSDVYNKQYTLDTSNRVTGEYKKLLNDEGSAFHAYYYDNRGRLEESYISGTSSMKARNNEYWSYDDNGNLTSYKNNGRTTIIEYDDNSNKLLSYDGRDTRFDEAGNITQYKQTYGFTYDNFGRAVKFSVPAPTSYDLYYNFQNHRVMKKYSAYGNVTRHDLFLFDASGRLMYDERHEGASKSGSPTKRKQYIYFDGQIVGYVYNGSLYYVHNDNLGRPELLTNANKSIVWQVQNTPFGRHKHLKSNSTLDFNIGFPGQYYDTTIGMWYNWNRWYDQSTGRYLQSDPTGIQAGANTYLYVNGDPLNNVDPEGLRSVMRANQYIRNSWNRFLNTFRGQGMSPAELAPVYNTLNRTSPIQLSLTPTNAARNPRLHEMLGNLDVYNGVKKETVVNVPAACLGGSCQVDVEVCYCPASAGYSQCSVTPELKTSMADDPNCFCSVEKKPFSGIN
ncbi:RHS repeat-associated protein [Alteromonadaceae bacterium 2753L.S.0a.02]|nr:RHS repeat-associated protein [Alteromonadaceae bacterium 2753L.S.0a.02]